MKKLLISAISLISLILVSGMSFVSAEESAMATTLEEKAQAVAEKSIDATKAGVAKTGNFVKEKSITAADKTEKVVKKGAAKTKEATIKGADKTKRAAVKGAEDAKKVTIKEARKAKRATAKGVRNTARKVEAAADRTVEKTTAELEKAEQKKCECNVTENEN